MADLIKIHKDNPFKDDVRRFLARSKDASVTKTYTEDGQLDSEEITVVYRRKYNNNPFTKIFQNKELLKDLSPWACKILVHIALHLSWNAQRINLTYKKVGLDERKYSDTMVELMFRRILVRQKPGWYWVNITLLIVGNIDKQEDHEQYNTTGGSAPNTAKSQEGFSDISEHEDTEAQGVQAQTTKEREEPDLGT